MTNYAAVNNKRSEQMAKRRMLDTHLIPYFGRMLLSEIRVRQIEAFKAAQQEGGMHGRKLKAKTINNNLAVLSRMLNCAVEWEYLESAPKVRWLKAQRVQMRFLEFEDADRLLQAAEPGLERTMMLVALRTGLRIGELLALRWDDVDLQRRQVHVRQSSMRGHIDTPKSGRSRIVPMTEEVERALRGYRHLRGPLVFCNPDGTHLTDNQTKRHLYRACRKAFLGPFGWHTLRHTFASHLAMRGAPIKAIQELLGHATIDMTMRYAHLSPAAKNQAIDLLERGTSVAPEGGATGKLSTTHG